MVTSRIKGPLHLTMTTFQLCGASFLIVSLLLHCCPCGAYFKDYLEILALMFPVEIFVLSLYDATANYSQEQPTKAICKRKHRHRQNVTSHRSFSLLWLFSSSSSSSSSSSVGSSVGILTHQGHINKVSTSAQVLSKKVTKITFIASGQQCQHC